MKAVMPDNVTRERTELLRMYGAEIVYSDGAKGSNGAVEMAESDASLWGRQSPVTSDPDSRPRHKNLRHRPTQGQVARCSYRTGTKEGGHGWPHGRLPSTWTTAQTAAISAPQL
jgi:hypothetical protein